MREDDTPRLVHNPAQSWPEPIWPAWLAAAVLHQAIRDSESRKVPTAIRQQAAAFLAGNESFVLWCGIAGLDSEQVRRLARARW